MVFDTTSLTSTTRQLRRASGLLLASALLALLGAAGLSLLVARRLSRPLEQLVARVQSDTPPMAEDVRVTEVRALAEALRVRDARIQELLERERAFNRDASHELRTPLAVVQGAVEILELEPPADTETFGRVEPEHTGFGVGLSLVERLARRFNCAVDIRAVEPHGTQVRLTWPSVEHGPASTRC